MSTWQCGSSGEGKRLFHTTVKMFEKRTAKNCKADGTYKVPYPVHSWISDHLRPFGHNLVPTKERPRRFSFSDGRLVDIDDSDPPHFVEGDILMVCFRVRYRIRPKVWSVEIVPVELVRIGCKAAQGGEDEDDEYEYEPLQAGVVVGVGSGGVDEEEAISWGSSPTIGAKRKAADVSSEDESKHLSASDSGHLGVMDVDAAGVKEGMGLPIETPDDRVGRPKRAAVGKKQV